MHLILKRKNHRLMAILAENRFGFAKAKLYCGVEPTVEMYDDIEYEDELFNFAYMEPTPDAVFIDAYMKTLDIKQLNILHIGIGNSSLAQYYLNLGCYIDGITVAKEEYKKARDIFHKNYHPFMCNKYSKELEIICYLKKYDLIIDNNLSSFVCCKTHFHTMMNSYVSMLKPGGQIITQQLGMQWVMTMGGVEACWALYENDLKLLCNYYGLVFKRENNGVFTMNKPLDT